MHRWLRFPQLFPRLEIASIILVLLQSRLTATSGNLFTHYWRLLLAAILANRARSLVLGVGFAEVE